MDIRRKLRADLHAARVQDGDQSDARYAKDAEWLDAELKRLGAYAYPTTWGGGAARQALLNARQGT